MMRYERHVVTPELASEWLKRNERNRSVSHWHIQMYERALKAGDWVETHQGVAFSERGDLIDGQHRLMAIARTGISAILWVATGLSDKAIYALDQGKPRSASQVLAMMGIQLPAGDVATLRVISLGTRALQMTTKLSPIDIQRIHVEHEQALSFVRQVLCTARHDSGIPASIRGLVGRASYTRDHGALSEFGWLLISGDATKITRAPGQVLRLRDMLRGETTWTKDSRTATYCKAARALRAFVDGEQIDKLYSEPDPDATFPIPMAQ